MPISHDDASQALSDINRTQQRSSRLYGYSNASPHLIVWGLIWAVGYGAEYFRPGLNWVWPALILIGSAASFWFGYRAQPKGTGGATSYTWRYLAIFVAIGVFISSVFAVMQPLSGAQAGAFFPLLIGFVYTVAGIWGRAWRLLITGAAMMVLTLVGFYVLREYFALWMAIVGGGGLVLGGLWFRAT